MHGVYRATRRGGGDHGKQARGVDAETALLAFHIAARLQAASRLVYAQRGQQRIARLLGRNDGDNRHHKDQRHGRQDGPTLALVTHLPTKRKTQRGRNQENRQHLHEVAQGGRVFVRMRRVGIEETTSVGTQHFDGLLRSNRAHGQGLLVGLGIFHYRGSLVVQRGLAGSVHLRLLELGHFQRTDVFVGIEVLNHTLPHQKDRKRERQWQQQPSRDAGDVHPKVANRTGIRAAYVGFAR